MRLDHVRPQRTIVAVDSALSAEFLCRAGLQPGRAGDRLRSGPYRDVDVHFGPCCGAGISGQQHGAAPLFRGRRAARRPRTVCGRWRSRATSDVARSGQRADRGAGDRVVLARRRCRRTRRRARSSAPAPARTSGRARRRPARPAGRRCRRRRRARGRRTAARRRAGRPPRPARAAPRRPRPARWRPRRPAAAAPPPWAAGRCPGGRVAALGRRVHAHGSGHAGLSSVWVTFVKPAGRVRVEPEPAGQRLTRQLAGHDQGQRGELLGQVRAGQRDVGGRGQRRTAADGVHRRAGGPQPRRPGRARRAAPGRRPAATSSAGVRGAGDGDRAVQQVRIGQSTCVDRAGLTDLEGQLPRGGRGESAAGDHKSVHIGQSPRQAGPHRTRSAASTASGTPASLAAQRGIGAEAEREHDQGGQLGRVRLGGRHRVLRAGLGDQGELGRGGQRAGAVVGDRDRAWRRSRPAQASVSTISSVRPDWDSATASTPSRSSRRR